MDYAVELFAQALIIIDDELYRPLAIKLFERYFCSKATSCYTAICLRTRLMSSLVYCWQTHHSDDSAPKKKHRRHHPQYPPALALTRRRVVRPIANSPSPVQHIASAQAYPHPYEAPPIGRAMLRNVVNSCCCLRTVPSHRHHVRCPASVGHGWQPHATSAPGLSGRFSSASRSCSSSIANDIVCKM